MAIAAGITAVVGGGAAGALSSGDKTSTGHTERVLAPEDSRESSARGGAFNNLNLIGEYTNLGPGAGDIASSLGASRNLAAAFRDAADARGLPTQQDITFGQRYAADIFGGQRELLSQSFEDSLTGARQQGAILGRGADDPILQAKVRNQFLRESSLLNANQTAFGAQTAMSLPGQRLNLLSQSSSILGGLASQAFQNRSALLSLGNSFAEQERNFRFNTATVHNSNTQPGAGLIPGIIGGAAGGLSLANSFGAFGGAGGGGMGVTNFGGGSIVPGSPAQYGSGYSGPVGPLAPGSGAYGGGTYGPSF